VANDYYELRRKASALDSLCLVLKFDAPRQLSIVKRLGDICSLEGVSAPKAVLDSIAERSGGDMRSAINDLQTVLTGNPTGAGENPLASLGARDVQMSPFDAVRKVLSAKDFKRARQATMDLDEEPSDFLTWMEHNVAIAFENPADVDSAYRAMARADVFICRAERMKYYGFWSYGTDLMTAGVAQSRRAPLRAGFRYEFPFWIRMMGSSKGKRAVRRSLSLKLAVYTHSSSGEVLSESMPLYAGIFGGKESAELRRNLLGSLSLTEEEIAYLLDVKIDSDEVARILEEGRKLAALDNKPDKTVVQSDPGTLPKQEKRAQRSLGEF
jgi:replication factor C large subunit